MTLVSRSLREVPLAVIDFETTGLSPKGGSRVVEVAVVRAEPGREPEVVLDTLVDPDGPVLCTSIHGISDEDVLGAPRFYELLGDLVLALEGALVGAYNASFDMAFFAAEARFSRLAKALRLPPHVCMMWMRPLIGLSKRCSLEVACQQHGLRAGTHRAAEDALACAHMWRHYLDCAEDRGLRTLTDLAEAGTHKYLSTLQELPYAREDFYAIGGRKSGTAHKPRFAEILSPLVSTKDPHQITVDRRAHVRAYWNELVNVLSDEIMTAQEEETLRQSQGALRLASEEVRAVHARVFADRLRLYAEDDAVSAAEAISLTNLHGILGRLGWAPGS